MKKIIFTLSFLTAFTANIAAATAGLVTLKSTIAVQNEQITFGDVFEGAGEKANYVIAPAPKPGKKIVFKASALAYVGRKHGLEWHPGNSISRVVVSRTGVRIPAQKILEEIRFSLEDELQTSQFELSLSTQHPNIQVSPEEDQSVSISSLSYSKKGNNFVAVIIAPANSVNSRQYKLSGRIHQQIEIPVANRLIQPGEKITANDLEFSLVRTSTVARNTLVDSADIIGKSPRRSLSPGKPLTLNNLGDPVTVPKGKLVTVTFKNGGIRLAITARALEPGAEGDIIRVENIASRKIIQAEIINPEEVRIITAGQRLANLN